MLQKIIVVLTLTGCSFSIIPSNNSERKECIEKNAVYKAIRNLNPRSLARALDKNIPLTSEAIKMFFRKKYRLSQDTFYTTPKNRKQKTAAFALISALLYTHTSRLRRLLTVPKPNSIPEISEDLWTQLMQKLEISDDPFVPVNVPIAPSNSFFSYATFLVKPESVLYIKKVRLRYSGRFSTIALWVTKFQKNPGLVPPNPRIIQRRAIRWLDLNNPHWRL